MHDEETVTGMDLMLSDLTLTPNPVRFDGKPPQCAPEKLIVATFGTLTGLIPEWLAGRTTVDKLHFFINDNLGTPKIVTDETEAVVWKADYQLLINNVPKAPKVLNASTHSIPASIIRTSYPKYFWPATQHLK